jgi:hypothetical protein
MVIGIVIIAVAIITSVEKSASTSTRGLTKDVIQNLSNERKLTAGDGI